MSKEEGKWAAARRAVQCVRPGTVVGLGTGSTAIKFLELLAQRVREEKLDIQGLPTSEGIAEKAREWGVPLVDQEVAFGPADVCVDGADEVDPDGHMVKGGGGALLREKLVALASTRVIIIVDESKNVPRLGATFRLPVEIVPFGWRRTYELLKQEGLDPIIRVKDGKRFLTDGHHYIADCALPEKIKVPELARKLKLLPGVVETGLFVGIADMVITGREDGGFTEKNYDRSRFRD
jgi:ribose 5-phosphate isomerase A